MTTTELNRAVARRTGETPDRIARHGFQLYGSGDSEARTGVDPQRDPESFCVDWDVVRYGVDVFPPPSERPAI